MLGQNNFTEEDKKKYIEFLNWLSKEARFKPNSDGMDIPYAISIRNHVAFAQSLLSKIESNILEIKEVVEPEEK